LPNKLRIISGGQTGVDRAALDAALESGLSIAGFVPLGRWAEDGQIPSRYKGLTECDSPDPAVRTGLNVENSDATLILSQGKLSGGSLVTWQAARTSRKPCLHIDLNRNSDDAAIEKIVLWVRNGGFDELNVAGPRASKDPEIYARAFGVLTSVFKIIQ
jgi:hypothetical protein